MTENKFQHYLPEDDETLIRMVKEGYAPWIIAETLGRPEVALYYRRKKLGLPSGPWPMSKKYKRLKEIRTKQ